MIELLNDRLRFSFPEVHPQACLNIHFQRTLRIPDDDRSYALPPGLGRFPLRHVDDCGSTVPAPWVTHGGVLLPIYQSEALWVSLDGTSVEDRDTAYPFAVKLAAGKVDAVTGSAWTTTLHARPQDYMVVPEQPWLDGFCVEKGLIRQFVAMPLGAGYSAEEQLTGSAAYGGLQILVHPMKREVFTRRFPKRRRRRLDSRIRYCALTSAVDADMGMGLAPGGQMKQEVYEDPFDIDDWDRTACSRCFVHLANSLVWEAVTGKKPPSPPPTAKTYTEHGLPWFEYYNEGGAALDGAKALRRLKSVLAMGAQKGDVPLPENETVSPDRVVRVRRPKSQHQVREGTV